jgi:hypothetical protein
MKWLAVLSALTLAQNSVLTTNDTSEVLRAVGAALQQGYLYPDVGQRLSDLLERKVATGAFEGIRNPVELGDSITSLLQKETNDPHLIVWATGGAPAALRSITGTRMVARAERLAGNIGYIDLRTFTGKVENVDAAFAAVQEPSALIIDVGRNLGGDPPIVQYISSYLFAERTHLLDTFARGDAVPQERWTLDRVAGQRLPDISRLCLDKRAYVFRSGIIRIRSPSCQTRDDRWRTDAWWRPLCPATAAAAWFSNACTDRTGVRSKDGQRMAG